MNPMERATVFFTGIGAHEPYYIIGLRIFLTISLILLILSIIPLTRDLGLTGIKKKYTILGLWFWKCFLNLYYAHKTILIHLFTAKENIFTGLDKQLKAEEDKKRNRVS